MIFTPLTSTNRAETVYVNLALATHIEVDARYDKTRIYFTGATWVEVAQTPKEIADLANQP